MNTNDLVRMLAVKLSADEKEVDEALDALIERVFAEVSAEGRSVVEGLGVFVRVDVGAEGVRVPMAFVPVPELAMRINAWNAGMEAVDPVSGEVTGVPKEGWMDVWDAEREERWLANQREQQLAQHQAQHQAQQLARSALAEAGLRDAGESDGATSGSDPVGGRFEEGADVRAEGSPKDEALSGEVMTGKMSANEIQNQTGEVSIGQATGQNAAEASDRKSESKGWLLLRVAAVLLIFGGFGWQLSGDISEWYKNRKQVNLAVQASGHGSVVEVQDSGVDSLGNEGNVVGTGKEVREPKNDYENSEGSELNKSLERLPAGLMGDGMDPDAGGYAIVLYSLTGEERANRVLGELETMGYKTFIMVRNTGDGPLYRVSVGQFSTAEEATAAAPMLPEPYRSNYFISRID